ncbi:MAG: hypothetical protein E6J90_19565 [Deltaproteobacteria bacterium]|nr:MAG: hypothetical protein E6J90_19565 [Deltaproteobacteria bacterium]
MSNVGTSVNACLGTGTGSPRLFGGARLYSRTRLATRVQLQPTPVQRGPAQCSPAVQLELIELRLQAGIDRIAGVDHELRREPGPA